MSLKTIVTVICIFLVVHFLQGQEIQSVRKKGFVFGTSLGLANTHLKFPDKSERYTNLGLDLKIGYMLNPNLGLLLTSNVSIYNYSGFGRNRKRDFGVLAPGIQYHLNKRLWFLGGVGIGGDNPVFWDIKDPDLDPLETKYFSGLGFVTSFGYEVFRLGSNFVVDIKARVMYRNVNLLEGTTSGFSYGILIGVNFY